MDILYQCDQCSYQEWREEGQEPWLCLVCGYMRWHVVASADEPMPAEEEKVVTRGDETAG